jgi:hypothetical protein
MIPDSQALKAYQETRPADYTVSTLGAGEGTARYLANRIDRAFLAGLEAGKRIEREAIEARLFAVLRGR